MWNKFKSAAKRFDKKLPKNRLKKEYKYFLLKYSIEKMSIISDDFFDNNTREMLMARLSDEEKNYLNNDLLQHWRTIVNSFPAHYYEQYATTNNRNAWFQRYLDLPSKDMAEIPDIL